MAVLSGVFSLSPSLLPLRRPAVRRAVGVPVFRVFGFFRFLLFFILVFRSAAVVVVFPRVVSNLLFLLFCLLLFRRAAVVVVFSRALAAFLVVVEVGCQFSVARNVSVLSPHPSRGVINRG